MAIVHHRGWAAAAASESPWYFPLAPHWQAFASHSEFPSPDELSRLYAHRTHTRALPEAAQRLRFVSSPAKKQRRELPIQLGSLYEGKIVEHGEVPTRERDWHDFFNALTFVAFPRAKWALHERQYRLLQQRIGANTRRLPGARTREQDSLALFDEGGIALLVEPSQAALLGDEPDAFEVSVLELCERGAALPVPFGHALPEHLIEGLACPLGTLHVVVLELDQRLDSLLIALDEALFRDLSDPTRFLAPSLARGLSLPVLEAAGGLAALRSHAQPRTSTVPRAQP